MGVPHALWASPRLSPNYGETAMPQGGKTRH
jgi:hypothetical protein